MQRCPITVTPEGLELLTGNDPSFTSLSAKEKTTFQPSLPNPPLPASHLSSPASQAEREKHRISCWVPGSKAPRCHTLVECPWVLPIMLSLSYLICESRLIMWTSKGWWTGLYGK